MGFGKGGGRRKPCMSPSPVPRFLGKTKLNKKENHGNTVRKAMTWPRFEPRAAMLGDFVPEYIYIDRYHYTNVFGHSPGRDYKNYENLFHDNRYTGRNFNPVSLQRMYRA
jgi:hypothetical protein